MKSFLAYTFIANEFDKGRDPLAILSAIIERSMLKGPFVNLFHLSDLQNRILEDWGFSIPISILENQVYSLQRLGLVEIFPDGKSGRKSYSLVANPAAVKLVDANESLAKEKYTRIVKKIEDTRIELGIEGNGEDILSSWLDSSPNEISKVGSISTANRDLKVASSVIAKAMGLDSKKNAAFIDDITDLVVGDQLYSAILETTQLESHIPSTEEGNFTKQKMADVDIFLDVGILARLRGHYGPEMKLASKEFLDMAHTLGAKTKTFEHTIDEMKAGMEAALNQIKYYPSDAYGPIPAYMLEESKTLTEISEQIDGTESDIRALGVEIVNSPPIQEGLGLDEIEFDRVLQQDVGMDNPVARRRDIASLRSIYMLRNGEPHRYIERSRAIFVTQNWALQSASHRFFKPYFDGKTPANSVQICFAEAVIASRLWTKLPGKFVKKPRSQVISYTLANLVPDRLVKEKFIETIANFVREKHISDEAAVRLRASRLLDRSIAINFGRNSNVSEGDIAHVLTEIIRKDKDSKISDRKQIAQYAAETIKKGLQDSYREDQLKYIKENADLRDRVLSFEKQLIAEKSHHLAIREIAQRVAKQASNLLTVSLLAATIIGSLPLIGFEVSFMINALMFLAVVIAGFMTLRGLGIQAFEARVERLVEKIFKDS